MEGVISVLSGALLIGGAFFNIAAAVGVIRLPDIFSRLHAAGMKDTMGSALTLVGLALLGGLSLVTFKLLLIWALLWFTCSVASHSLARGAILGGVRPLLHEGDDLFDASSDEIRRDERRMRPAGARTPVSRAEEAEDTEGGSR